MPKPELPALPPTVFTQPVPVVYWNSYTFLHPDWIKQVNKFENDSLLKFVGEKHIAEQVSTKFIGNPKTSAGITPINIITGNPAGATLYTGLVIYFNPAGVFI